MRFVANDMYYPAEGNNLLPLRSSSSKWSGRPFPTSASVWGWPSNKFLSKWRNWHSCDLYVHMRNIVKPTNWPFILLLNKTRLYVSTVSFLTSQQSQQASNPIWSLKKCSKGNAQMSIIVKWFLPLRWTLVYGFLENDTENALLVCEITSLCYNHPAIYLGSCLEGLVHHVYVTE